MYIFFYYAYNITNINTHSHRHIVLEKMNGLRNTLIVRADNITHSYNRIIITKHTFIDRPQNNVS